MRIFYTISKNLKTFFTFTNTELKGLFLLSFLISLTLTIRIALPHILHKDLNYNEHELMNLYKKMESCIDTHQYQHAYRTTHYINSNDSVTWPPENNNFNKNQGIEKVQQTEKIEINLADSSQLTKIKGLGPYFASKIIKLRNRYHGLYSIWQLQEIHFMDSAKITSISPYLSVNEQFIKRHDLNNLHKDSIKGNYYFTFKMVDIINNYRKQHGPYKSVEEVTHTGIVPDSTFQKIKHYLEIRP